MLWQPEIAGATLRRTMTVAIVAREDTMTPMKNRKIMIRMRIMMMRMIMRTLAMVERKMTRKIMMITMRIMMMMKKKKVVAET